MGQIYRITYRLKTSAHVHGEFSHQQTDEELSMISVTNELSELFTDIFYKHRDEAVIGLEILSIEHAGPSILHELEMVLM